MYHVNHLHADYTLTTSFWHGLCFAEHVACQHMLARYMLHSMLRATLAWHAMCCTACCVPAATWHAVCLPAAFVPVSLAFRLLCSPCAQQAGILCAR